MIGSIGSLDIAEEFKELFKLISTAGLKRRMLGVPLFDSEDPRLKPWNFRDAKNSIASLSALCLGPLFYFANGMWKKGITTAGLFFVMAFAFKLIPRSFLIVDIMSAALVIMVLCALMGKYDYYRKIILYESFWW